LFEATVPERSNSNDYDSYFDALDELLYQLSGQYIHVYSVRQAHMQLTHTPTTTPHRRTTAPPRAGWIRPDRVLGIERSDPKQSDRFKY
jgi:hypothetical protein